MLHYGGNEDENSPETKVNMRLYLSGALFKMAKNSDSEDSEFEAFFEEDIMDIQWKLDTDELNIKYSSDLI